jgi:hypothetical protein
MYESTQGSRELNVLRVTQGMMIAIDEERKH